MTNIVVIGMGYVGIPCAALLADVPGFTVTGVQRRSLRFTQDRPSARGGRSTARVAPEPSCFHTDIGVNVREMPGLG
jgi:glycine/D-amino acid oxidase-like deaminating enzyme